MYTIDSDNNIAMLAAGESIGSGMTAFGTKAALRDLIVGGTINPVELWNSFAGTPGFDDLKDVKKFTDRETAARRIWEALIRRYDYMRNALNSAEASNMAEATPAVKQPKATKAKAQKEPKAAKAPKAPKAPKNPDAIPSSGKGGEIVRMITDRECGATVEQLMEATGWQKHSVRGFISILGKKLGKKVSYEANSQGIKYYKA